jgi:hypothetical protein
MVPVSSARRLNANAWSEISVSAGWMRRWRAISSSMTRVSRKTMRMRSSSASRTACFRRLRSEFAERGAGGETWISLAYRQWRRLLREDFCRPAWVTGPRDLAPLMREASIWRWVLIFGSIMHAGLGDVVLGFLEVIDF